VIRVKGDGHRFYAAVHDNFTTDALVWHGCMDFERVQAKMINEALRPSMTVLDLGANIGYYTLLIARRLQGSGRVYAFEPEAFNFRLLRANVLANGYENVILLRHAVSDIDGGIKLFRGGNSGEHSLCYDNISRHAGSECVSVTTLDSFAKNIGRVDMVKMDIQGAEGRAIRGGEKLLTKHHPIMFFELAPHLLRNAGDDPRDIIELLESWGYVLNTINESQHRIEALDIHTIESRCKMLSDYVNVMAKMP